MSSTLTLLPQINWTDYELLDSGEGERLERFGPYTLRRPDPQTWWRKSLSEQQWQAADASFVRTTADKGEWRTRTAIPEYWPLKWQSLTALAHLTPFKHTGIFPEQSAHWQWLTTAVTEYRRQFPQEQPRVLNLFAYTGLSSIVATQAGAFVTHVDASRSALNWARRNQEASGLDADSIRWMLDDVFAFVQREVRRGRTYHGLILDPPSYGHGPDGKAWNIQRHLGELLTACRQLLAPQPALVLLNAYAVSTSAVTLTNMLTSYLELPETEITAGELVLVESSGSRQLSTGIFARWQFQTPP